MGIGALAMPVKEQEPDHARLDELFIDRVFEQALQGLKSVRIWAKPPRIGPAKARG
jgi:hypothetical protein